MDVNNSLDGNTSVASVFDCYIWSFITEKINVDKISGEERMHKGLTLVLHYIRCSIMWCQSGNYKVIAVTLRKVQPDMTITYQNVLNYVCGQNEQ